MVAGSSPARGAKNFKGLSYIYKNLVICFWIADNVWDNSGEISVPNLIIRHRLLSMSTKRKVAGTLAVLERADTVAAVARLRSNFAINHLRSAVRAAREAKVVEEANAGSDHGPWFDDMIQFVPAAIVMAGAALEASANELIQDILDGSTNLRPTNGCKQLLLDLKEELSLNALDRFRRVALLFDKDPQIGNLTWQDARHLVSFRNYFLHFKPEWDDGTPKVERGLVKALKPRIAISIGFRTNFRFPYGFMTYGCAKWSVQTVLAFSAQFASLLGACPSNAKIEL